MDKANINGNLNFILKIENRFTIAMGKHIFIGNFTPFLKGSEIYKYIPQIQIKMHSQNTIRLM
jgi:hypothetical protein